MCSFGTIFSTSSKPQYFSLLKFLFFFPENSKTLLTAVDDKEKSSAIGSAVVLRNFIKLRGAELFHAVPEIVQDSLAVSFLDFCTFSESNETRIF